MHGKTLSKMKENFENKVCTVFTQPVCMQMEGKAWVEHHVVRIDEITSDGVWAEHPYQLTKSFFTMDHIVFIQEEQELDPTNPVHAKMMKEYEKTTGEKLQSDVSPYLAPEIPEEVEAELEGIEPEEEKEGVFIDIDALDALAKEAKRQHEVQKIIEQNSLVQIGLGKKP
jgi:hypothetical protein